MLASAAPRSSCRSSPARRRRPDPGAASSSRSVLAQPTATARCEQAEDHDAAPAGPCRLEGIARRAVTKRTRAAYNGGMEFAEIARTPPRRRLPVPAVLDRRRGRGRGPGGGDDGAGAADVLQVRPEPARPRAWLLVIARSAMLDHFRREQRRRRYELAALEPADRSDGPGISNDLSAAIEAGLHRLSAGDREVIALRVILDLDAARRRAPARDLRVGVHDPAVARARPAAAGGERPCPCLTRCSIPPTPT